MIHVSPGVQRQDAPSNQSVHTRLFMTFSRHISRTWEAYFILLLSAFLHLIIIDKAIFNIDEADIFSLARDAVTTGWLPLASTRASIGTAHLPFEVYLFMLPASLSANPLGGEMLVALLNVGSVVLTYFFVRRYYGRLAATLASLLYTASVGAWTFSRHIWNPNLLPFFVILLFIVLFRGVVERRKGWFTWATLLMGILYQLHPSSLYLLIPIGAAVLFAYKTIRWRDLLLGAIALLIIFTPYAIWEFHNNFYDFRVLFSTASEQARIDSKALHVYLFYLFPILRNPYQDYITRMRDVHLLIPDGQSILRSGHLLTLLTWARVLPALLLLIGMAAAGLRLFAIRTTNQSANKKNLFVRWWGTLQARPDKQGLALLLFWQIAPLLLLTRHSIALFTHYFTFFLPGQFILLALCFEQSAALVRRLRPSWERIVRSSLLVCTALLILAQLIGLGGTIIDINAGHFQNASFSDISDQMNALQKADQIARQRHISRIYLSAYPTYIKMEAMYYLSRQIQTPVDFFSSKSCFILPAPDAGPVLFLTNAGNGLARTFFQEYADATLVATSPFLGTNPYEIYVLSAGPEPKAGPYAFQQPVQLLSAHAQPLNNQWLTTRWSIQSAHQSALRTTYNLQVQMDATDISQLHDSLNCAPTITWAGDQLFVFHTIQPGDILPAQIKLQASTFTIRPLTIALGPLTGFTDFTVATDTQPLRTTDGQQQFTLSLTTN